MIEVSGRVRHPDFDLDGVGPEADEPTEALLGAVVDNALPALRDAIEQGADVNFLFGTRYRCAEGYTPLMSACHRGHHAAAKALLQAGADPNFVNQAGDLTLFWAIDGGEPLVRELVEYGADLDFETSKGWTPLSYALSCGEFPKRWVKGRSPELVLRELGATALGSGPPRLYQRVVDTAEAAASSVEPAEELGEEEDVTAPPVDWAAEQARHDAERREREAAAAREQEEREMAEITSDLASNPFIKEKGRGQYH